MAAYKRALVLLHGWAMTPRIWEPVLTGLQANFDVHSLPLPGYGPGSPGASGDYGALTGRQILDRWSDACLDAAPDGALWIAWSLGALVALNAALRPAASMTGLVLVSATPRFTRAPDWKAGIDAEILRGFLEGIESGEDRLLKRFVLLQAGDCDDPRALARFLRRCVVARPDDARALAAGLRVLEEVDLRPELGDVGVPVRVIHGTTDRVVPVAAGARVAGDVPHGDLVRLDAGHAPFVTRPEAFIKAVSSWT